MGRAKRICPLLLFWWLGLVLWISATTHAWSIPFSAAAAAAAYTNKQQKQQRVKSPPRGAVAVPPSTITTKSKGRGAAAATTTSVQAVAATSSSSSADGGDTKKASIPNEVFNLVKSIVGAGVLSLPAGVAAFGNAPSALIPATLGIALMGTISAYTFGLIGRVCRDTNTASYSDAWDAVVGQRWSPLIAFSCLVDCFAGNLSYSMILADTILRLAASVGIAVTRTQSLLGVTVLLLLPLCMLQNLSSLAPFSLVGILGMLYTTVAMAIRYFGGAYRLGATTGAAAAAAAATSAPGQFISKSLLALPSFGSAGAQAAWTNPKALILLCMLSNAYIAHFNAPKFLQELENPTLPLFYQVIAWSFGTAMVLFAAITALGFATFGAASNGLILNNYATQDTLMSLSRIAVAISITCSYPLIFVGTRDGLLDLFKVKQRSSAVLNRVTWLLLAVITAMASQLTNLGLVASVGGATFGTALVFVYPAIMFRKSTSGSKSTASNKNERRVAGAIGLLGIVMGTIGTILSFQGADV